jgi:hypothetical protein
MSIFKKSKNYKKIAIITVASIFAVSLISAGLYIKNQQSLRLAFEDVEIMSAPEISQNCGFFKFKRFCPEYCIWNVSNEMQKCSVDVNALGAAHKSYEDYLKYLVGKGSINLEDISINEPYEVTKKIAGESPEALNSVKDESVLINAVLANPKIIQDIKNPSEAVQAAAIKENSCVIQFIDNPSGDVIDEAIKKCPTALKYIKNPSREIEELAIKSFPASIEYISNPDDSLKSLAQKNGYIDEKLVEIDKENIAIYRDILKKIAPSLSEEQIDTASRGDIHWPNPHMSEKPNIEEVKMAISRNVSLIPQITKFYPELEKEKAGILRVVDEPEAVLKEMKKPFDEDAILKLIFINPYIIKYIENPTEKMQITAVFTDRNSYQYIKNPSEKIKMFGYGDSGCDRQYPDVASQPDDDEWINMFIDFKGNMPKDEAIKLIKANGLRMAGGGQEYVDDSHQIFGSIQKNKVEYIQCKILTTTSQLAGLQPLY